MKTLAAITYNLSQKHVVNIPNSDTLSGIVDLGRVYSFAVIHCDDIANANGDLSYMADIESGGTVGDVYDGDGNQQKVTVPASGALHIFVPIFGRYIRLKLSSASSGVVTFEIYGMDAVNLD